MLLHQPEGLETQVFLYLNAAGCAVLEQGGLRGLDYLQHIAQAGHRNEHRFDVMIAVVAAPKHLETQVDFGVGADNHTRTYSPRRAA